MEAALWYVLTGPRGGSNRARILEAIEERPRNTNQLARELDLDYKTVEHHLDVLLENNLLRKSGDEFGAIYLLTQEARGNWDTIEEIRDTL